LKKKKPQALILDIQVPGPQGMELLRESKALYSSLPVIVITAYSTSFTEADAKREGADGYFTKPFDLDALIEKLKAVAFTDSDAAAEPSDAGQHVAAVSRQQKCERFNHLIYGKEPVNMKNRLMILAAAVATMGFSSLLHATERGTEKMNINLWGNGISSVRGHFAPGVKSTDFLNTGANFGIAWQYFPLRNFGVQAAYELGWQNVANKYRNTAGETPAFVVHQITLSGLYNFANVIGSNARFRPYVGAGLGVYPFRLTKDGISGDVEKMANNNKFEKTSFGLNGSAGVEFQATNRLSVFGGARYHYLFAKDNDKFGADSNFGDQALLSYGLGLSYHLGFGR
jgi:CheY-like chemotaxis protein